MTILIEPQPNPRIALFAGTGAVLAQDVGVALAKLNLHYTEVTESDIKRGKLKDFNILIIPGGYTAVMLDTLEGEPFDSIRRFVASGGKYIGICAGAYLAPQVVKLHAGREAPGLNIIAVENVRRSGMGLRKINIVNPDHPITKGYQGELTIWYQNGPYMKPGNLVTVLAMYDTTYAAIVVANYHKGKVVLFSVHPEGSLNNGVDPQKLGTLGLLKNAILW